MKFYCDVLDFWTLITLATATAVYTSVTKSWEELIRCR